MTQQQYFGQFSGEDYPTFEDWRKAFRTALATKDVLTMLDSFTPFIDSAVFMKTLSPDELERFSGTFLRLFAVIETTLQRTPAPERAAEGGE